MSSVTIADLGARAVEYLSRVREDREELIVTENSVPVLKVVPLDDRPAKRPAVDEVFADVRGKVTYNGDLLEPTASEWKET